MTIWVNVGWVSVAWPGRCQLSYSLSTESCKGRCTDGFIAERKCQCDELCSYYQSCCADYVAECKPQGAFRGAGRAWGPLCSWRLTTPLLVCSDSRGCIPSAR